jgi:hypothetical protein
MATEPRVSTGEIATSSSPATETIPVFKQDQVNKNLATTDTGTDAPTVTLQQSQATSQAPAGAIPYNPPAGGVQTFDDGSTIQTFDDGSTLATGTDGRTSASNATDTVAPDAKVIAKAPPADASISDTKSGTDKIFNASTNPGNPITPSPNVLDQFASYTYSLSWYLLTPQQANIMSSTSKINTNEWSLLMQSGGAAPPVTPAAPPPPQPTPPATQTEPVSTSYNPNGTANIKVKDLAMKNQAAIAAGTDPNAVNDQGMAFGGGGLTGA